MQRIKKFIKTPMGSMAGLVMIIVVGALLIMGANSHDQVPISTSNVSAAPMEHHTITRDAQPLRLPDSPTVQQLPSRQPEEKPKPETVSRPRAARGEQAPEAQQNQPKVLPISLITENNANAIVASLSRDYAPYGRLIPCETIITLESSKIETPIIGLVTEDVWHDGRLIIPAGAEVHGRAALDRARERISASGKWVIVRRDRSPANGTELVINGVALDRQRDDVTGEYGLRDGSAGMVGHVIKTDDWQEIKLFASTFLAGMASGLQEMRDQTTAFGSVSQVPEASAKNAALQGTSDVLNTYAAQIAKMIAEDGFYVRVPAGKQFYIYVTETLDKGQATKGNLRADLFNQKEQPN
jgi:hypothetical protein